VQLFALVVAIRLCIRYPSSINYSFSLFIALEFARSVVGGILAYLAVQNVSFYIFSEIFTLTVFFIFAFNFLKRQNVQSIGILAIIGFLYFVIAAVNHENHMILDQIQIPLILEVIVSVVILNFRIKNNDNLHFKDDPWSIIAFTLFATLSLSMVSDVASLISIFCNYSPDYTDFFDIINCSMVFIRYTIIGIYLLQVSWGKLSPASIFPIAK
jgi:hypothetical protein